MYILGINPRDIFPISGSLLETPMPLALGSRGLDSLGNEYVLVQSAAAITVDGQCGFISGAWLFTALGTANDTPQQQVGFSRGLPTAAGQRFWAQIWGRGNVRVLANAAAGVNLNTTATAGSLDDDATVGSFIVRGVNLIAAGPVAEGPGNAIIQYPSVNLAAI